MAILVRADLIPRLQELERRARARGIEVRFVSGFRSRAQQARLYAAYLARGRRGLPAAPPGSSNHERGAAVDFSTRPRGHEATVGHIAESLGFRWGGRFSRPDPVHIDFDSGWSLADLLRG